MRRWAMLVALWASQGFAQPADPVADAAARGEAAYADGRYQDAVEAYTEAYRVEPVTTLLFNIAYIYDEHLAQPRLARTFYKRYVEAEDADPTARVKAFRRIVAIDEDLLAAQAKPPAAPPPEVITQVVEQPVSDQRLLGYTALGTGGVALVTGVVFAALTASTSSDYDAANDVFERRDLGDQGRSQALAADISLGVGVALVGAGVWLLLTDGGQF